MEKCLRSKPSLLVLLLSLIFHCLISSTNELQHSAKKKMTLLNLKQFQWKEHEYGGAQQCLPPKSRKLKGGAILLEMKHRDYCFVGDWNKKLQRDLILDDIHVKLLQSQFETRMSNREDDVSKTQISLSVKLHILNYFVTVKLGGRNMNVIVDTGSDLTWVQCQPCKQCYNQNQPLFNPFKSPSYKTVLCNSTTCKSLQSGTCGKNNPPTCNYVVNYVDGSYTHGELGFELLNLGTQLVKDFVFGCGRDNKVLFEGVSGLMGLGRSGLSLVSQTGSLFGGVFSYCLPTIEAASSGSLVMGSDFSTYKNVTPISYTKMALKPQMSSLYFLTLTGLSVKGVYLRPLSSIVILIDSGTTISWLVPSVYKALKAEFLKHFSWFPQAPGVRVLDTCFNLRGIKEVKVPNIKMHFEGNVELNVDATGILYVIKTDLSQVCFAFASLSNEDQVSIIGNFQQKNQRVVYDNRESKIGFAKERCGFVN